jgi:hypothetical protein
MTAAAATSASQYHPSLSEYIHFSLGVTQAVLKGFLDHATEILKIKSRGSNRNYSFRGLQQF